MAQFTAAMAQRMAKWRKDNNLTYQKAADAAGTTVATWKRLESLTSGGGTINANTLHLVARAIGLTPNEFLEAKAEVVSNGPAIIEPYSPAATEPAAPPPTVDDIIKRAKADLAKAMGIPSCQIGISVIV